MESSTEQPALTLRSVAKHYRVGILGRRVCVLDAIDLQLAPGQALGLLGANGSGKSTLLRLAAGIELPSSGRVELFGASPQIATTRRQVGFVPEGSPFPGELKAALCLAMCAEIQGLKGREGRERCARMLERVGLAHVRKPLRKFSQGMLRRFALAQAFVHEPQLLLLDEPSSGLDAEGLVVLSELVQEARERGTTMILCSHYPPEAFGWTDRVALIHDGKLHESTNSSLFATGPLQFEIEGLDASSIESLKLTIEELGGRLLSQSLSPTALLEFYRRDGKHE